MALVEFGNERVSSFEFDDSLNVVIPLDFTPFPLAPTKEQITLAKEAAELRSNIDGALEGGFIDTIKAIPDAVELGIRRLIGKVAVS
jgi:hypothetical protein